MNNNGWVDFSPKGPAGKFEKYQTKIVIPISISTGKIKGGRIYLTNAVMQALGTPKFIKIMTRGNNVALMSNNSSEGAYAVSKKTLKGETVFISAGAFIKQFQHDGHVIIQGVYDAHIEAGKIIFDVAQSPSRF